jgi:hypothetical protein
MGLLKHLKNKHDDALLKAIENTPSGYMRPTIYMILGVVGTISSFFMGKVD